jgi:hypothetical protein
VDTLAGMISNLKVEVLDPVLCKGLPKEQDLQALDALADSIAAKHKEQFAPRPRRKEILSSLRGSFTLAA